MGIPERIQIDNAMSFFGSPTHPRGMGTFIRLCLHNGVEPWFIPMAEPWRNGMIENFNDRYQQMFLGKVVMTSVEDLQSISLTFEQRHNSRYLYSKIKGHTLLKALAVAEYQSEVSNGRGSSPTSTKEARDWQISRRAPHSQ